MNRKVHVRIYWGESLRGPTYPSLTARQGPRADPHGRGLTGPPQGLAVTLGPPCGGPGGGRTVSVSGPRPSLGTRAEGAGRGIGDRGGEGVP
jgi:hypothetical protein